MEKNYFFIILILIPLCLNKTVSNWKLSIKDENNKGSLIKFLPGIFTKVTLSLTNENGEEEFDASENPVSFKIALKNKNLVSVSNSYTLTPSESLVYSVFIGIRCGETLSDTKTLFSVESTEGDGTLTIDSASLSLSNEKAKIDIEPLMTEIPEQSYNLFKVNKEPYNIESINLVTSLDEKTDDFTFEKITLDKYDGQREEYSSSNSFTNGILRKFKFGTKKLFEKLSRTNIKFGLTFETEELGKCFELVKKSFDLKVIKKKVETIGENVKKAIVHTLENISNRNEFTNSLEFKLSIPKAPIAITCEFRADTSFTKYEDDIINHVDLSATYYDNVFTTTGDFNIKLGNLNSSLEYYSKCVFSNTGFLDELKQKVSVTIGNFLNSDIISKLKPSRDIERPSQCVKFVFSNAIENAYYATILPNYCRYVMRKGLPLLSQIFNDVVCRTTDSHFGLLSESYINICVAPSPLLSINRLISQMTPEQYNKNFEQFIDDIQSGKLSFIGKNVVKSVTRYIDKAPDTSKIIITDFKKNTGLFSFNSYNAKIISTNEDPIQCYYKKDLTKDESKKFWLFDFLQTKNIILNPNTEASIDFNIKNGEDNEIYPVYLDCYSLPNFAYRYENTGTFSPFSYFYDSSLNNQKAQQIVKVEIDCNNILNKMNPHCLKQNFNNLIEKLRTDIPEAIIKIQDRIESFKSLAIEAQLKVIQNLNNTLNAAIDEVKKDTKNIKNFLEKGIEMAKYLANKDCTIYSSSTTTDEGETYRAGLYLECRNSKKHILSSLIGTVKDQFQCSQIVQIITSKLVSDDFDENLKYLLLLVNEITNNPDALEEGLSQAVYDLTTCLQEKFDEYWPKIESYLEEKKGYLKQSILAVKKDVSNILMQSISNLVNVLHFEEIDGYIQQAKNQIKKNGLIALEKAKKINKNIFNFIKNLNEFGSNYYQISGSMALNVTVNPGQLDSSTDAQAFVSDVEDKGIKVILHSNYMLREKGAYAMQTVVFDSPLVSVNAKNEVKDGAINTFIGITLYDKNRNEIAVSNLSIEDFRPQILFKKKLYSNMKTCLFYNEKDEELDDDGVITEDDYKLNGETYIRCIPKHLTTFTIGSVEKSKSSSKNDESSSSNDESSSANGDSSSSNVGLIIFIIVLCLLIFVGLIVGFIMFRKKCSKKITNSDIESAIPDNNGINA